MRPELLPFRDLRAGEQRSLPGRGLENADPGQPIVGLFSPCHHSLEKRPLQIPDRSLIIPARIEKIPCSFAQGISPANTLSYRAVSHVRQPKTPLFAEIPCFFPSNREFAYRDEFAPDCLHSQQVMCSCQSPNWRVVRPKKARDFRAIVTLRASDQPQSLVSGWRFQEPDRPRVSEGQKRAGSLGGRD